MHQNIIQIDLNREERNTLNYLCIWCRPFSTIICSIKIRLAPTARHDNIDFKPIVTKISKLKSLSVVVGDKAYDSEDNHILVREKLNGFSIIPTRYEQDQYGKLMEDTERR